MSLVLTIRVSDGPIHIGDDVEIQLLGIKGGQARLAFSAPDSVAIHRDVVYWKIQDEKSSTN